ncbi:MAG: alpha/beta fold hydrolase [Victivallales bacterium]|nr:alpha/beta fold hydrolase [Victivallales bacterium]
MLHGNPTWSFMYRGLVAKAAAAGWRAVALDNLGSGLSDKPQDWHYTLEKHIANLEQFVAYLALKDITLVMHDWGGPMGMGYAVRHLENIRRLVLMNTAAYLPRDVPRRIYLCRVPWLGPFLVRRLNLLLKTALRKAVTKPLAQDVIDGYCFPYRNWNDRIALLKYPQDIPLSKRHPSYASFKNMEDSLGLLSDKPIALLWGERDFCLHTGYLELWRRIYPEAKVFRYPDASHFLLEDRGDEVMETIIDFLSNT